jgi:hypothetical protein
MKTSDLTRTGPDESVLRMAVRSRIVSFRPSMQAAYHLQQFLFGHDSLKTKSLLQSDSSRSEGPSHNWLCRLVQGVCRSRLPQAHSM